MNMYNLNEILDLTIRESFKQAGDFISESEITGYRDFILDNSTLQGSDSWQNYKWILTTISPNIKGFSSTTGRGDQDLGENDYICVSFSKIPNRKWEIESYPNLHELEQRLKCDGSRFGALGSRSEDADIKFCIIRGKPEKYEVVSRLEPPTGICGAFPVFYVQWDNITPYTLRYSDNRSIHMIYKEYNGLATVDDTLKSLLSDKENAANIKNIVVESETKQYKVEQLTISKCDPVDGKQHDEKYIRFSEFNSYADCLDDFDDGIVAI